MSNKQRYNKRYGFAPSSSHSLNDISKTTKISKSILQQVYNRGTGAWKNNPSSVRNIRGVKGGPGKKMSKEQWSYARVYSFVMGGTTRRTADKDLWEKHKSKKKK
jgi:hypothetical protein